MDIRKNINWAWILVVVGFTFGFIMLENLRESEKEVKVKQKVIDSLNNEILLLEDAVEMREQEVDLLMDLSHDDFDKREEVDKIERILEDEK